MLSGYDLDTEELMNQAVDSPKGLRVWFHTQGDCKQFLWRCYAKRRRDREDQLEINLAGRSARDLSAQERRLMCKSEYDILTFHYYKEEDRWWLQIEKADNNLEGRIELL